MKISVAALTFFFFYACVAEISAQPTGDKDGGTIQSSGDTDCGAAEAQKTTEQLYVILRAVEAKLSDTQTEIEVLKSQVQSKSSRFGVSSFRNFTR